jgi:3-deoxy-manno-octulosonate cytidylyltransferase (CMP-KDO synthetase)
MIQRVHELASAVSSEKKVFVTTDDERIGEHVRGFGGEVLPTAASCPNGTVRVYEALRGRVQPEDIVVNLQGDAVLTPPWILEDVLHAFVADPSVEMATPATRMTSTAYQLLLEAKRSGEVGGTTVVCDQRSDALYFSKAVIPYIRTPCDPLPVLRHIGLYAYRYRTLERYVGLPETPLEQVEGLEQLRALEHGIRIRVVLVDYRGRTHASVDSPEDLKRVELLLEKEGELIP